MQSQSFTIIFFASLLCVGVEGYRTKVTAKSVIKSAGHMRNDDPPLRLTPSTTVSGCSCMPSSKCGATINGSFSCDWCRVQGDCGKSGIGGAWDYCEYPPMLPYEAQSASEKMQQLWGQITAADVVHKSGSVKSLFGVLTTMIGESMRTPFDTQWDVMPEGRTKVIHSQGSHCQFELDIAKSPYTGLLAAGKQVGIIRMGSASSLDVTGKAPFPGLSFKFLRSGVRSGNFVALRASGPATSDNNGYAFFDQEFSKIVNPPAELKALMKFQDASNCISMVGLSDMCSHAQDGTAVDAEAINFPYCILFEASGPEVHLPVEKMTDEELLDHLSSIAPDTHLLNVYAKESPTAEKAFLGTLTTKGQCVKSVFGDTNLFFRHQRMEEDFFIKPAWVDEVTAPGCDAVAAPSTQWQCPGIH